MPRRSVPHLRCRRASLHAASWLVLTACSRNPSDDATTLSTSESSSGSSISTSGTATSAASDGGDATETSASASAESSSGAADSSTGDPVVPPTCGPLEGIPSEPGPHVAMIEALEPDTWLDLGPPAADPTFGIARGRSWGGRALVLAPDLRGAFFTGEGVHAFVKPDGYAMDDIWFYDIHAHAWIAIHPGTNTVDFTQQVLDGDLSIDGNGQLQDADGHPVPVHTLIHAWDYLTYDPVMQRFAFLAGDGLGRYYMPGLETIEEGLSMLEAQRAGIAIPPMSPWFWSVADCSFERHPIANGTPDIGGFAAFVHATATDQFVYAGAGGVAIFADDAWSVVADSGPRPTGYDHGVAYDSLRNRLYMGSGDGSSAYGFFVYDIATSTWTNPASAGPVPSSFRTNDASVFYDAVSDVVTVFHYVARVHYTYDIAADTWTSKELPAMVLDSVGYPSFNAFFDPELNAYFVHAASDSTDNGRMWVHRRG